MTADLGKFLLLVGILVAVVGVLFIWVGKLPGIGKLPGDIYIERKNFTFYFPLTTSLVISIILSILLWFFLGRK
ncbi:MAG: DUF2905 domain-containing protein [Nitrospirae bacterium]|nr:DUF2905 domain-containing protein [Nitrospirota bacterium]